VATAAEAEPAAAEAEDEWEPSHYKLKTNEATTSGAKHVSLDFYYDFDRAHRQFDNNRHSDRRRAAETHVPQLWLTVGATDDLDVFAGTGYTAMRDLDYDFDPDDDFNGPHCGSNVADTQVGVQWRFWKSEEHALELAYLSAVTMPTGTDTGRRRLGTSQEFWSWEQALLATKDWNLWTTSAEVGYSLPFGGKRGDERGALTANLAAGYHVFKWLQPEAEINYSASFVRRGSGSDRLAATVGLLLPFNDTVCIGAGVQQALMGRNEDKSTTFLFMVRLWW
jgi:hypothetical protein